MTISEQNISSFDAAVDIIRDSGGDDGGTHQNGNGKWCGNAWGYNVYYSESSSINITLKIFKFAQQPQLSLTPNNNNFSFRLIYKFLKRTDAKLRYYFAQYQFFWQKIIHLDKICNFNKSINCFFFHF